MKLGTSANGSNAVASCFAKLRSPMVTERAIATHAAAWEQRLGEKLATVFIPCEGHNPGENLGSEKRKWCTVVNLGARKRESVVPSSILGLGSAKVLYCRQFWRPEARQFCTVVNFGGRKRESVVLSSILAAGSATVLY